MDAKYRYYLHKYPISLISAYMIIRDRSIQVHVTKVIQKGQRPAYKLYNLAVYFCKINA